jgi:hypothetical protein
LANANYQNTLNQLVHQDYRFTWIAGYTINNDPHFTAICDQTNNSVK